jgi:HSP20 family protein
MVRPTYWRREPSSPLHLLQNEFQRMLAEYLTPRPGGPETPAAAGDRAAWSPPVDVYETLEEMIVVAEIPGVDPASIELAITGNILSLAGVKEVGELPEPMLQLRDRSLGPFLRQISLPHEVDFDKVQADANQGVLKVRLPKLTAAKPRTIPINRV